MDIGTKIGAVAAAAFVVLGSSLFVAWQAVRKEQIELQTKIRTAEQQARDANARQESRKTELDRTLAQLAAQKKKVQTPAQAIDALPGVLPLPRAIPSEGILAPAPNKADPKPSDPSEPSAALPVDDLKPLYDFALSCRACQAQLASVQSDLKDEQTKTTALSRERDSALQAARGGSVLKRVVRAAKWFAVGAAAGVVAAKLAH